MVEINLKMLGDINEPLRSKPQTPLQPKYMVVVTAADLALWLKYTKGRKRGKHTFKPDPDSLLKIDSEIQRGLTATGELRQEDSKIEEIAKALVGNSPESEKVFLGTLVWNVRKQDKDTFSVVTVQREGLPSEYKLVIDADSIYLTDSAHRHIGICEALRKHREAGEAGKTTLFSPQMQFPVEIYNVDKAYEKMLFRELNSKQKKITAAKQQEVDNTTSLGRLKEAIRTYDQEHEGFFVENIEVNANQNDRHTLMTMSVFVAAIKEMFGKKLIEESASDDGLRDSLAEYFVTSFYALRDTVRVKCSLHGREEDVAPFSNLYNDIIRPVEDSLEEGETEDRMEEKLKDARTKAEERNKAIRDQDKLNGNSFIKGISYALGRARQMSRPQEVVDLMQSRLISSAGGKYFQVTNPRMTQTMPSGHSIATIKDDGSLNVQVQTHTLNEIKAFFRDELGLEFERSMTACGTGGTAFELNENPSAEVIILKRAEQTHVAITVEFDVGAQVVPEPIDCKLQVKPEQLNNATTWIKTASRLKTDPLIAAECRRVSGWEHEFYSDGIARYRAVFHVTVPQFVVAVTNSFTLAFNASVLDEVGEELAVKGVVSCRGE